MVQREMTIEATAATKTTRKNRAAAALEVGEKFERGACRAMCACVCYCWTRHLPFKQERQGEDGVWRGWNRTKSEHLLHFV